MKAFVFDRPNDDAAVGVREMPVPELGDAEILIEVAFCGLNFADVLARRGLPGYASSWPFVPGLEVAGTISASGPAVRDLHPGDRVVSLLPGGGGCAQRVAAPANLTVALPPDIGLALASTFPLTWATAVGLCDAVRPRADDLVLVTSAAGGVAAAVAAVLNARGTTNLVGAVGSDAKKHGASPAFREIIVRAAGGGEGTSSLPGSRAFDVVFESVGGAVLRDAVDALAIGGRLVTYGAASGASDPSALPYGDLRRRNASVAGFSIIGLARAKPDRVRAMIRDVIATAPKIAPPAPSVVPLSAAKEAHLAYDRGTLTGKTVVEITSLA